MRVSWMLSEIGVGGFSQKNIALAGLHLPLPSFFTGESLLGLQPPTSLESARVKP